MYIGGKGRTCEKKIKKYFGFLKSQFYPTHSCFSNLTTPFDHTARQQSLLSLLPMHCYLHNVWFFQQQGLFNQISIRMLVQNSMDMIYMILYNMIMFAIRFLYFRFVSLLVQNISFSFELKNILGQPEGSTGQGSI